jgi:hypothetical protein
VYLHRGVGGRGGEGVVGGEDRRGGTEGVEGSGRGSHTNTHTHTHTPFLGFKPML